MLINNEERRDYYSQFWIAESTLGDWNPTNCEEAYAWGSSDVKTEAYWTRAVGSQVTLVVRGDEGVFIGKAVYPVLPEHQDKTLKQLLTGPETVFTGTKDLSKSSGDLRSTFQKGDHGGSCGDSTSCIGDMFIDFDNALVANSQSGFNAQRNYNRLTTTYAKVPNYSPNGHVFGGLGGSHVQGGWGADYESSPTFPYCPSFNAYGSSPGNQVGNGESNFAMQSDCLVGKSHRVDFAIYADASDAMVSMVM